MLGDNNDRRHRSDGERDHPSRRNAGVEVACGRGELRGPIAYPHCFYINDHGQWFYPGAFEFGGTALYVLDFLKNTCDGHHM